jgi:hypothetical protein
VAITSATIRLAAKLRRDLLAVTNQHTRALTEAWANAWDDLAGDLEAALLELINANKVGVLSQATILRSIRLQQALDVVARRLTRLTDDAGRQVATDLPRVVRDAVAAQEQIIASQVPKAQVGKLGDWVRVDARQLDAIVTRSTERVTSQMWPLSAEADAAVRRELVRGLATGSGPRATAAAIVKRTEGEFNGGLARALTIARTETLDAHRVAAAESHAANADVLAGWIWLADLSGRTEPCPACLGMNGTVHPLSEPGPLGHQNCRCSRVPKTKSWADLGIDLDEPGPSVPDAQDWFDAKDDATQRKILGPARYAAYKRGEFPLSKWATRRSNDGWRDSYVPASAPKSA